MNQQSTLGISRGSVSPHRLPVVLVACFGVIFSVTIFFVFRSREQRAAEKEFQTAAEDRAYAVKSAFDTKIGMLDLVRSALITDGRIERQEFGEIVEPLFSRSRDMRAVEWVPRVADSGRAEFEAATQRDGIEGFRICEPGSDRVMMAAPRRSEYFPIHYMAPREDAAKVYGYDFGSEPKRLESLLSARDTGKPTASGRIPFVNDTPESPGGFFVAFPVYGRNQPTKTLEERRKHLAGFVLGMFRPGDMIESGLAALQPEGIDVALYDPSQSAAGLPFYVHASREQEDRGVSTDPQRLLDPNGLRLLVELGVAGHPWTIICAPTPAFLAAHTTRWPIGSLVVGLLFTALVAGALWMNIEHAAHLEEKVAEQTQDIRSAQEEVLFRLASASQWCDVETPMHLRRVGLVSQALARANGWYGEEVDAIRQAAPMHDIGKIGIPDAILQKGENLTAEELEVMKSHTRIGAEILAGSNVPMLKMARDIALCHHERWDGKGYPRGLAGENIPENARIVAIVDAYDTLTHDGVGHPAMPEKEALAVMQQESERQFDPQLLADFFRHLPEIRRITELNPDDRCRGGRELYPKAGLPLPSGTQHAVPEPSSMLT